MLNSNAWNNLSVCKQTELPVFHLFVAWSVHTVVFLPIFCFLVIFILLLLVLSVLFLVAIISFPLRFFMYRCIDAILKAFKSPPTFLIHAVYVRHLWYVKPYNIVMSFLVLGSICWSSLVHFKNGPEYLTRRTSPSNQQRNKTNVE